MTAFAKIVAACGMSLVEAQAVLLQGRSTILKKSHGTRSMTVKDLGNLRRVWDRVRRGEIAGLPEGCREMSDALAMLRGVDTARAVKPNRRSAKVRERKPLDASALETLYVKVGRDFAAEDEKKKQKANRKKPKTGEMLETKDGD